MSTPLAAAAAGEPARVEAAPVIANGPASDSGPNGALGALPSPVLAPAPAASAPVEQVPAAVAQLAATAEVLEAAVLLELVNAAVEEPSAPLVAQVVAQLAQDGHVTSADEGTKGQTQLLPVISPATASAIAQAIPSSALPTPPSEPAQPVQYAPPAPLLEATLPAPVVPLPTPAQIPAPPALDRMDSTSSLAVAPPTPAPQVAAPYVSTPYAPDPALAASTPAALPPAAYQPTPVPAPAPVAPTAPAYAFDSSLSASPAPPVPYSAPASQVVPMDFESAELLNKRSAPEESSLAADELDRETKRQRLAYEQVSPLRVPSAADASQQSMQAAYAPAPVAAPQPAPTPGYDPNAFSGHHDPLPATAAAPPAPTPVYAPQPAAYHALQETPAPVVHVPAGPEPEGPIAVFTKDQHKFAVHLLKTLKKHRSAPPFLRPVDPIALNIPDYFRVITRPIDLGTIENKLNATGRAIAGSAKLGRTFGIDYIGAGYWEGRGEGVYRTAEEFEDDVDQVWQNCFRYNGPKDKNPVSAMAGSMQETCQRQLRSMPTAPRVAVRSSLPLCDAADVGDAVHPSGAASQLAGSLPERPSLRAHFVR